MMLLCVRHRGFIRCLLLISLVAVTFPLAALGFEADGNSCMSCHVNDHGMVEGNVYTYNSFFKMWIGVTGATVSSDRGGQGTSIDGYYFFQTTSGTVTLTARLGTFTEQSFSVTVPPGGTLSPPANFYLQCNNPVSLYLDKDKDGYGGAYAPQVTCMNLEGYVSNSLDCDDTDPLVHPGATEVCDGADQDCDGAADEGLATGTYFRDTDGDGYGDAGATSNSCAAPAGYVAAGTDCDDTDPLIHPGATEVCDRIDQDCDGVADEGVTGTYFRDTDGDGFGDAGTTSHACSPPTGYVMDGTDCDDGDPDEVPGQVWYRDADGDGYSDGTTNPPVCENAFSAQVGLCAGMTDPTSCLRPSGYSTEDELLATSGDCDDGDVTTYPGAPEFCDDVDHNCNGQTDDGEAGVFFADRDRDGYGDPGDQVESCSPPEGFVAAGGDCDDDDPLAYPGQTWYRDVDGDGYSDGTAATSSCLRPPGYRCFGELARTWGDCQDGNGSMNPGESGGCTYDDIFGTLMGPRVVASGDRGLTLALSCGDYGGQDADWWLVASTPLGWYFLDLVPLEWRPWLPGMEPTLQAALVDFPDVALGTIPGLPGEPGRYVFYFAVDLAMNGVLDEPLYYQSSAMTMGE